MSESRVLSEIEMAAASFKICVLPRNPKSLSCSVWAMPDPAFHVGVIWRQNTGAAKMGRSFVRFGMPGDSDFRGWLFPNAALGFHLGGRLCELEAKSEKGRLTADQSAKRDICRRTGVLWGLARSYVDAVMVFESWGLRRPS